MKIRMLEHFQGRNQPTLAINQEYDSAELGEELTKWLLDNDKAIVIEQPKHYGGQAEPELRHDDEIYEEVKKEAEEPKDEIMTTEKPKRRRRRAK